MRYCALTELAPGMVLGRHIYGFTGDLLLARGQPLDEYFLVRLNTLGFPGVYIEEPGFEGIEPPEIIDGSLRHRTEKLLADCFDQLANLHLPQAITGPTLEEGLARHPEIQKSLTVGPIRQQVSQIVQDILESFSMQLPCLLLKSQSHYQVQHGLDAMIVATLLGVNFRFLYRELRQLALAALLHDVGKSLLSSAQESNIGPEHPQYREHPMVGGLLVLNSGDDLYNEGAAIQQHHERQDGQGFPYGLKGEGKSPLQARAYHSGTIYRLAEIVSVADAYDVLTSGTYQPRLTPEEALKNLIRRSQTEFNPYVVKTLVRTIQIFPVGCQVRILRSTQDALLNCRGVVAQIHTDHPHQCDLILSHDGSGQRISPQPVSLLGDDHVRLELVL